MRKTLLISFFFSFCRFGLAQYVPNSSQSFQFASMFNPAFSGVDEFTSINLGYEYRWAGISGAPKSLNLSVNTRLKHPLDITSNALHLSNATAVKVPGRKLIATGLGVNIFQTTYGQIKTSGGSLNYSIHFPISKKVKLALGLSSIVENTKLNLDQIVFRHDESSTDFYQSLIANGTSKTNLDIRAGLLLYTNKFYLGFSYFPLWQTNFKNESISVANPLVYSGSAQIGYSIVFGPEITVKPSIMALLKNGGGASIDYNLKMYVQRRVWFGFTYRDIKSGVALLGFNVNNFLTAAYSYEISLGKFKQFNDGSHELVLSLRLNNFRKQDYYSW